ncbi:exocyst complex component 1-like [Discoglossus pictus]
MAAILKTNLQKEFFKRKEEKLVHVLQLSGFLKDGSKNCICVSVTSGNNVCITWIIFTEEKAMIKCEMQHHWYLKDLTLIDGIHSAQDNPTFQMYFGSKVYSMEAYTTASKYAFLRCLRKLNNEYFQCDLHWVNFDHDFVGNNSSVLVPDDTPADPTKAPLRPPGTTPVPP